MFCIFYRCVIYIKKKSLSIVSKRDSFDLDIINIAFVFSAFTTMPLSLHQL